VSEESKSFQFNLTKESDS